MKYILSPLFAIITTLLLTWLTLSNPTLLQVIDLKIADQLIVQEKEPVNDVVLIDISSPAVPTLKPSVSNDSTVPVNVLSLSVVFERNSLSMPRSLSYR
jgi:hypothetical protein